MTYIEKLSTLHPDVIDEFIRTGTSDVIPMDLQQTISQMVFVAESIVIEILPSVIAPKIP